MYQNKPKNIHKLSKDMYNVLEFSKIQEHQEKEHYMAKKISSPLIYTQNNKKQETLIHTNLTMGQ